MCIYTLIFPQTLVLFIDISALLASVLSILFFLLPKHPDPYIDLLFEGIDFYTSLTHAQFKELCQDLFHGTLEPIEKVLHDSRSKINKSKLSWLVV